MGTEHEARRAEAVGGPAHFSKPMIYSFLEEFNDDVSSRTPHEEFISLRHRLQALSARYPDRKGLVVAAHYGMSRATICRGLRRHLHQVPGLLGKADASRCLRRCGYDQDRMTCPPPAVRPCTVSSHRGRPL